MNWLLLSGTILAPAVLSLILLILQNKTPFGKLNFWIRQAIISVLFGALVCLSVKYYVPYGELELYAANAITLCAGFAFGGPVGIAVGIIGAAYRFFGTFTDAALYTTLASSIAILLSGIFAAFARKFLFEHKKISVTYGVLIVVFTEVLQAMTVFLTHLDDVQTAFDFIEANTLLSIAVNVLCVFVTSVVCVITTHEKKTAEEKANRRKRTITQVFALCLLFCIILSFLATGLFTSFLQSSISEIEVKNLLSKNVSDAASDIKVAVDRELISLTKSLAERLNQNDITGTLGDENRTAPSINPGTTQKLVSFAKNATLTIVAYVGEDGKILVCNSSIFDGLDVTEYPELSEFSSLSKSANDPKGGAINCLVSSDFVSVNALDVNGEPTSVRYKLAAVDTQYRTGYVLTGFSEERYEESRQVVVAESALHRHIGQSGFMFVLNEETGELLSTSDTSFTSENALNFFNKIDKNATEQVLSFVSDDGVGYYYWLAKADGYLLIGTIPVSEANFTRDISVYVSSFMLLLVFFLLFTVVFLLLRGLIVKSVHKINNSLTKITEGDLDEKVEIRNNREFNKLSDDINKTVGRLKELISEAEKRIDKELEIAKDIQLSVLPSVFPPYPNRTEFEIFACMDTAKEVGGDFYDFYLVDENKLAFLIADVSGKGIPAAMFMMNAKSIIKSLVESGLSPSEVFTKANEKFCEANDAGMFVTAWMGFLDLKTGKVSFANAGHNPPLVRHGENGFEYFKSKPGLVLGGIEGMRYREGEFTLEKGDEIFLYTDGVTEATDNNNTLFGEERLLSVLNANHFESSEKVCGEVKKAIGEFVGEAPQFDDITMVSLKYFG